MSLPGILPLCGVSVGGLMGCLRVFPATNVRQLPAVAAGRYVGELELIDPENYADLWFQVGTGQYVEPEETKDQGRLYKSQLVVTILQDHPEVVAAIATYRELEYFLAVYLDGNQAARLIGTPDFPLRFESDFKTGQRGSDVNGFTLGFSADLPDPSYHYPAFEAVYEDGRVYVPGSGYPGGGGGANRLLRFTATTTLGGVSAGEQVTVVDDETGQTTQDMLAPDQAAQASLQASSSTRQFGAPVGVTLSYSVTEGTHPITSVVVNGQAQTYSDGSPRLDGSVSAATAPNTDATFTLVATDASGATVPASASVRYQHRRYWGGMVQDPFSLSDVQLSAVLRALSTQEFSTSRGQSFSLTLSDQYAVVARPESQGAGTYTVGGLPNTAIQSRLIQFTNADGYRESFRIERSATPDTGTFNFSIS